MGKALRGLFQAKSDDRQWISTDMFGRFDAPVRAVFDEFICAFSYKETSKGKPVLHCRVNIRPLIINIFHIFIFSILLNY